MKVYQVSRRYIMLFMHNNKYLPLKLVYLLCCCELYIVKFLKYFGNISWNISGPKNSRNFTSLATIWCKNIPEKLNPLSRVHARTSQTTDGFAITRCYFCYLSMNYQTVTFRSFTRIQKDDKTSLAERRWVGLFQQDNNSVASYLSGL